MQPALHEALAAPLTGGGIGLRQPQPGDVDTIQRYIGREDAQAWLSGSQDAGLLQVRLTVVETDHAAT
ncbi:MAG: hypothetical protein ACT452_17435 [Microthrixaceae bacterium]